MKTRLSTPPEGGFRVFQAKPQAGFTLVEIMIAASLTGVLLVAALGGVVAMQKSYSATESYGTGLADQMRLLDSLAQDLRRAISPAVGTEPWILDADGQGIKITVPDYYRFNSSDPQHLFPIANDPFLDPVSGNAYYSSGVASGAVITVTSMPYQTIVYRYANGVITRSDPWAPLVASGSGGYKKADPVTVTMSMDSFPTIAADNTLGTSNGVLRYKIAFSSTFQPLAVRGGNNDGTITLHNVTFIRSKNLTR